MSVAPLLAGATGLVGSRVLALVPDAVPIGRRATGRAGEIVADSAEAEFYGEQQLWVWPFAD